MSTASMDGRGAGGVRPTRGVARARGVGNWGTKKGTYIFLSALVMCLAGQAFGFHLPLSSSTGLAVGIEGWRGAQGAGSDHGRRRLGGGHSVGKRLFLSIATADGLEDRGSASASRERRVCELHDVRGKLMPYDEALEWQKALQASRIQNKLTRGGIDGTDALILVEHPAVYTLGSSSAMSDILFPVDECALAKVGDKVSVGDEFEIHRVQRGGKITYHCPGQLVGYPIVDLACHQQDIGWYLREVEGVVMDALAKFGLQAATVNHSPFSHQLRLLASPRATPAPPMR